MPQSPLPEPPVPVLATGPTRSRATNQPSWAADSTDDAPHALVDPPAWSEPASTPGTHAAVGASDDDVADIDWVDEVEQPVGPPAPVASQPHQDAPPSPPSTGRPAATRPQRLRPISVAPAQVSSAPLVVSEPRPTWREWIWTQRNPLLAVAMVVLVLGAVSVKRWKQRLEEMPRIAEIGRTEGFKKLDAGDFFAAKKILADAAAAVDAMGGRFEGADAIRHAALEAAIFTDLVPRTLEDLVEEAMTASDLKGWSAHFAAMYGGRSIIIASTIAAVPDATKPGSGYTDAYRVLVGRGPEPKAIGRIDYTGFELFDLTKPKMGESMLFGARLAALEFDDAFNVWLLKLEPQSGVFMTHPEALQAIHWPTGDPVEESQP